MSQRVVSSAGVDPPDSESPATLVGASIIEIFTLAKIGLSWVLCDISPYGVILVRMSHEMIEWLLLPKSTLSAKYSVDDGGSELHPMKCIGSSSTRHPERLLGDEHGLA